MFLNLPTLRTVTRRWRTFGSFSTAGMAAAVVAMFASFQGAPSGAQMLYTSTTNGYAGPGEVVGNLYTVDPATAATRHVGPLRISGDGASVGVTGLAVHPGTGALYGITNGLTPLRPSLITIDPKTATTTVIGTLGHPGSDITFDAADKLFIWLTDLNQLGTVDLATGAATPLGFESSSTSATGGGLAIDGHGIAYIATTTAVGTLDTMDTHSGTRKQGPVLSGAPYLSAIHSLTFSPSGELYGVNTNLGAPAKTALVIVNPASGVVSIVGALPDDAEGLAFSPERVAVVEPPNRPHFAYIALALAVLVGVVVMLVLLKRSR